MRPSPGLARRIAFVLIFFAAHVVMVVNFWPLGEDMVHGDGSGKGMIIPLRYDFLRLPADEFTMKFKAEGRIAADFAQIYFPARNPDGPAYGEGDETPDPFGRPSRIAPAIISLCAWTLCRLDYGPASLAHAALQYLIFLGIFLYAFKTLNVSRFIPLGVLLANACLFLTPVGLTSMERGQFSLYVATAYLLLLLGLIRRNVLLVALSALFAYVKWTSFPFIFVAIGTWLLSAGSRTEFVYRVKAAGAFAMVTGILFLAYIDQGLQFLSVVLPQEYLHRGGGMSLLSVWPRFLVKSLPFILAGAGVVLARRSRNDASHLLPFLVGVAILLVVYPTTVFDYSVPCLLGFIPLVSWWVGLPGNRGSWRSVVVAGGFLSFLILASFSGTVLVYRILHDNMIYVYMAFALLFMLLSFTYNTTPRPEISRQ